MTKIIIIDDEEGICSSLVFALEDDYDTEAFTNPAEGLKSVIADQPAVVLLDLKIGSVNGIDVLKEIRKQAPGTEVIMITAYGTISSSVEALQNGAYSYVTKPLNMDELFANISRVMEYKALNRQVQALSDQLERKYRYEEMVGKSDAMQKLYRLIDKVKEVDTNVLITGESGTGKELVARAIHYAGKRRSGPLEVVNCAAIPETLLESELFGYEKGAFTGATQRKAGKFELAHGGTLFLDEIGDMPVQLQAKLLRVLQKREVTRLGGTEAKLFDVRVIAATNVSLEKETEEGHFREDLYFRLNVIQLQLPPLRERTADLPILLKHFIDKYNREMNKSIQGFSKEAEQRIFNHHFPGNIRELANIIESSMVITDGEIIEPEDLPAYLNRGTKRQESEEASLKPFVRLGYTLKALEKAFILETLEAENGHRKHTATKLGISERSLRDKIKQYEQG
ncbi:sigma-54-dependent transcriptional regulator [Salisediminibacterium selenitireducens]|uniref:Two component, sigma54 specific, transcriptional regulator, Fis family n=1 Tax=Bacillus selenitireducens (strain ATCC 700615 / DSM 15326 / MLS10) TaxID=439292 RepID=D6XXB4_BACIE|nr:sigma-54 dependent transcriptional regulator [Salisediminibacterium selenitireducens]ADH97971.1 two component, sigma54 specific, transcriptional regulator, Fis family [[Bacillus] selenitireducens MLS10]